MLFIDIYNLYFNLFLSIIRSITSIQGRSYIFAEFINLRIIVLYIKL